MPRPSSPRTPQRQPSSPRSGPLRNTSRLNIVYIVLSGLVICSMLAVALATIDFTNLWGEGEQDVIVDPNVDLIAEQQTVVAQNPDDVDQVLLLANMLANTGQMNEAIDWYEKAIDLAPNDPSVRLDFARSLQANGMKPDAEEQFMLVLEQEPDSLSGHYYLAKLYLDWQPRRQEKAVEHFQRVLEINPDSFLAEQAKLELESMNQTTPVASPRVAAPGTGT